MNIYLKLTLRNWWRNKLYFCISLFSLTVGLACTNLLVTYFIHEYNIESTNPHRENIYILRQDSPMEEGKKVPFISVDASNRIKDSYAEVAQILRINSMDVAYLQYGEQTVTDALFLRTDATLLQFFDYKTIEGNLKEALEAPDKLALSADCAKRVFGDRSAIGEIIETTTLEGNRKSYQVVAVVENRPQSFLQFDALTSIGANYYGGPTLLKLKENTDIEALLKKIKDDKIPTLLPGQTEYHIDPIKEIYFNDNPNSQELPLPFFHHTNVQLLYIALISALLVLVIACFNYSNLNLSRTLQQLKMIHIEKLMGAKLKEIRLQLFWDATATVLISFLLSLLLINDVLILFNKLLPSHLTYGFFFSWQVLPLLLCFALLLAVVPGLYISHRLSKQSLSEFRKQYAGKGKQHLIQMLVTLQFMLSLALVYATTVARSQMDILKSRASRYENLIEIGNMMSGPRLQPFQQRLATNLDGIESMSLSSNSIASGYFTELAIEHPDGTEERYPELEFDTDTSFFSTMHIHLVEGLRPADALKKYGTSFYINERYARLKNVSSEDFGQKTLQDILPRVRVKYILTGMIENYPTASLQKEINPQRITVRDSGDTYLGQIGKYVLIRLQPEKRKATLERIERIWKEMFNGQDLVYTDMHQRFMELNKDVMQLNRILNTYSLIALLLTCFGVFGISWYAVRQRTREIAIRKVHGASTLNIVWLLNRPFLGQIVLAYIVSMPIAWYIMQWWLEQFVYRPTVTVLQFVLPFLVVWAVALLTVGIHSWIAAKVNPIHSLKIE